MKIININLNDADIGMISDFVRNRRKTVESENRLCFIRILSLDKTDRILLRKAINKHPHSNIVVLSDKDSVAKFAWKINVFHFLDYPIDERQLKNLRIKIVQNLNQRKDFEKLRMPFKGGFDLLHPDNICVLKGDGNYCRFYFRNDKPKIYTGRIGNIADKLMEFPYMVRVNKSLIININHLIQIVGNEASFTGVPKVKIKLSENSVRIVKRALLWMED